LYQTIILQKKGYMSIYEHILYTITYIITYILI